MSLGLYIHVPFCRRRCSYCDFHFSTNRSRQKDMVAALVAELELRKAYAQNDGVLRTLYLGGGTPSLLETDELDQLFSAVFTHFRLQEGAEVTLEANPEDISPGRVAAWKALGINRLSIGIQSFFQKDLSWMNRAHSPAEAAACMEIARQGGISSVSIDLIFGLPDMDMEAWAYNLEQGLALQPDHFSLYALSLEKKSALRHWVGEGRYSLPPDQVVEAQYLFAHEQLRKHGFRHYELSSFARKGQEAQHNSGYWQGLPYLGLGPSAHSFDGGQRSWNVPHNAHYLKALGEGKLPLDEMEVLTEVDHYNEYLMTRLRMAEGLNITTLEARFDFPFWETHAPYLEKLLREGQLWRKSDEIGLTPAGWIISDRLIGAMFR